jgi:galactokinase
MIPDTSMAPVRIARPETEQIDLLVSQLKKRFAVNPADIRVVKAPLRISPLGAHIDHQLGIVTGMTIDQSILMAFVPTDNGTVHLESLNFNTPVSFRLTDVPPYRKGDWGNYIRGAVLALQQKQNLEQGLIGVVSGELPIGGLSSSAAVTIAYLLALEAVNRLTVSPTENIPLVRYTENIYIGLNNGILDQSVILSSYRDHLTTIDCLTFDIDHVSTRMTDPLDILVVYSGVTHVLVGTDYNNRVAECQEATRQLLSYAGEAIPANPRLRHVNPELFHTEGHRLPENLHRRATHFFGEMQRVSDGITAWQAGDLTRFGELVTQSGESSIKYYESGSRQLITLYEILNQTSGVYGTRFSGAGFRGSCIALVDPAARQNIAEAVHKRYPVRHTNEAEIYSIHFCQPDGQATLLNHTAAVEAIGA